MKHLLILLAALFALNLSAQKPIDNKNEFGIDISKILKNTISISQDNYYYYGIYIEEIPNPYKLYYKRHLNENISLRFSVEGNYRNEKYNYSSNNTNTYKIKALGLNAGFEMNKNLYKDFYFLYGLEFAYKTDYSYLVHEDIMNSETNTSLTTSKKITAGPIIGFEYIIGNRISISTLLSFNVENYQDRSSYTYSGNTQFNNTSKNIGTSYNLSSPGHLVFAFRF